MTEDIVRQGVDGIDRRQEGQRPAAGVVRTLATFANPADLDTAKRGYKQLQGNFATLIDDFSNSYTVFVRLVRIGKSGRVVGATGQNVNGNYILRATWELEP